MTVQLEVFRRIQHDETKKDDTEIIILPVEFEEAVAATGYKWFHYWLLLCCGSSFICLMNESESISFIMPSAQCYFGMTSNEKGVMSAMSFIGMICTSHLWGYLSDTIGRRKVIIFSLLMDGICTIIASFMPYLYLYLLLRFFNGVFICGPGSVTFAYLGEFHSNQTRASALVWAGVCMCFGFAFQVGTAWWVVSEPWSTEILGYSIDAWQVFSLTNAITPLLASLMIWSVPESPKFLLSKGLEHEALNVLSYMYSKNTGKSTDLYPVKSLKSSENIGVCNTSYKKPLDIARSVWNQTFPLFKAPFLLSTFLSCALQLGIYSSAIGFLIWIPDLFNRLETYDSLYPEKSSTICEIVSTLYANTTKLDSVKEIIDTRHCDSSIKPSSFYNSLYIAAGLIIAYLISGFLLKVLSNKILIFLCLLSSTLCGVGMLFAKLTLLKTIFPILYVCLSGMCMIIATSVVIDIFPTYIRGMAVCLSLMMGRVGTIVSSVLVGTLIDESCSNMIIILSGLIFVCSLLTLMLPSPDDIENLNSS